MSVVRVSGLQAGRNKWQAKRRGKESRSERERERAKDEKRQAVSMVMVVRADLFRDAHTKLCARREWSGRKRERRTEPAGARWALSHLTDVRTGKLVE